MSSDQSFKVHRQTAAANRDVKSITSCVPEFFPGKDLPDSFLDPELNLTEISIVKNISGVGLVLICVPVISETPGVQRLTHNMSVKLDRHSPVVQNGDQQI